MANRTSSSDMSMTSITTIKPTEEYIVIDETAVVTGTFYKFKDVIFNATYWHKFIVANAYKYSRDHILSTILDLVYPNDLIPVFFGKDEEKQLVYFFARNCGAALTQLLYKNKLVVDNPLDKDKAFHLTILLRFTNTSQVKIDVSKNVTQVLKKRFNLLGGILDLSYFCNDPDLVEFCPLSQPKLLSYVMHLQRRLFKPTHVNLSHNGIRSLDFLETFVNSSSATVKALDLGYNKIMSLVGLESLKHIPEFAELWLEGNPLCSFFDEYSYIQQVKLCCPKLQKLDNVLISFKGLPTYRRNYLCSPSGYDLVDQFLEYYFTVYDSKNRASLKTLYHKNAVFSLTAQYQSSQITSSTAQLVTYKIHARNLKALADFSRSDMNLRIGNQVIVDFLGTLPQTVHDPYSFTVDLMHHTDSCSIVMITGVFKEVPSTILDVERLLGFSRSFVLESISGEYCIVNDQLHVYNALTSQQQKAFVQEKATPCRLKADTPKQRTQLINALKVITNLTSEWAKKCLEEAYYDLKDALALFVELYKADKIPPDGFQV